MRTTFIAIHSSKWDQQKKWLAFICCFLAFCPSLHAANEETRTLVNLLEYVSVDYSGAVNEQGIIDANEYAEMREFASQTKVLLLALPSVSQREQLIADSDVLVSLVDAKASPNEVSTQAKKLRDLVVASYNVATIPSAPPPIDRASLLYSNSCSSCHGLLGQGDGPAGTALNPKPSNFHNAARMNERSVFALYTTLSTGVPGTAMVPFAQLPEEDRWALALFVSSFTASAQQRADGEHVWSDAQWHERFADGQALYVNTTQELQDRWGQDAIAVQAYLKANPQRLADAKPTLESPLIAASRMVDEAVSAYTRNDKKLAQQLSVRAYLEGFELTEATLKTNDASLVTRIEREMLLLRQQIKDDAPSTEVMARVTSVKALLQEAERVMTNDSLSPTAMFASAWLILVREGIEALLVIAAMIAFLRRAERHDALPYVHAGWVTAFVLGAITWYVATYLIKVAGASREMTEGVSALVASIMLVYVGYWLHRRTSASNWNRFIKGTIESALAKRTLWAMAFVSFLAVYREMFETVLFYQALWTQAVVSGRNAFLGGFLTAVATLAILAWLFLKYAVRLPLRQFFTASSVLICVLAIVMAGEGIRGLQEAGALNVTTLSFPTISWLGIFPTTQGLVTQLLVCGVVIALFTFSNRRARDVRP